MQVIQGQLQVSDRPGLGITLKPDVLRANLVVDEQYWDE
jgi:L-alanine-DL-glutamate epimerase-like enolase superfamily enzyme